MSIQDQIQQGLQNLTPQQNGTLTGRLGYTVNGTFSVPVAGKPSLFYVRWLDGGFIRAKHDGRVHPQPNLLVDLWVDEFNAYHIKGVNSKEEDAYIAAYGTGIYVPVHTHLSADITDLDADKVPYEIADALDWPVEPTITDDALDYLADRLTAVEDLTEGDALANPMTARGDMIYENVTSGHLENTDRTGVVNHGSLATEAILGDCDLTLTPNGTITISYDFWFSAYWPGHDVAVVFRLRRSNLAGTALVTSATLHATIDSGSGHDVEWTGTFTDSTPTDGHYVITCEEVIGAVSIYTDTRQFALDTSPTAAPARLPIGSSGDFLRVDGLLPAWTSTLDAASSVVDLILTDDDGEVLTDDDGVVLLGDL